VPKVHQPRNNPQKAKENLMISNTLKSFQTAALVPLAMLCLATAAQAQTAMPMAPAASMPMGGMHAGTGGSADMKQSMMGGMDGMQKMPMSGDTDKDFAMMMKMHHQGAVDMAQMELAHGKSPAMKAMAKNIIAAQKKEIAHFDGWLATQK
jgi:uncharacterized protein (DUF305 family)